MAWTGMPQCWQRDGPFDSIGTACRRTVPRRARALLRMTSYGRVGSDGVGAIRSSGLSISDL
jgi:hypothetical protein